MDDLQKLINLVASVLVIVLTVWLVIYLAGGAL